MTNPIINAPSTAEDAAVRADLAACLAAVHQEAAEFRDQVRAEVLRQHYDGGWCLPGTQAVLSDLDLPTIRMRYEGTASILVTVSHVAGAESAEQAYSRVTAAFDATCSDTDIDYRVDHVAASLDWEEVRED